MASESYARLEVKQHSHAAKVQAVSRLNIVAIEKSEKEEFSTGNAGLKHDMVAQNPAASGVRDGSIVMISEICSR